MSLVNRCVMLISPKAPLYDWVNSIFPDDPIEPSSDPFSHDEGTVFLIPEIETTEEFEEWIYENFKVFFEGLLEEWCTDETLWPKELTYEQFKDWFYISFQTLVYDTLEEDILKEDLEDIEDE
ncbi:MAG: hypothetical protein KDK54_12445 [Leptospiraceae bacterium]|nr:hypothetical protein [Leptospiraceae bacterium]